MASLNKVILIGNTGRDPEIRNVNADTKAASFTLATTERYKDKSGEIVENTEWHSINVIGRLAEIVEKYVKKGSQLYIEGKIRTRSYTTSSGEKKYVTEISADNIQLLGNKEAQSTSPAPAPRQTAPAPRPAAPAQSLNPQPDDLPF